MNNAAIWGIALPLAAFAASVGLLFVATLKKWTTAAGSTVQTAPPPETPPVGKPAPAPRSFFARLKHSARQYRWEILLGASFGAVLLYALVFAPPRLTGSIPIDPGQPGRPFYNLRWLRDFLRIYYDSVWVWSSALTSSACLALLTWAGIKRSRLGAQIVLLYASLNLAGVGQWLLAADDLQAAGKGLYMVAVFGFGAWAWMARDRLAVDLEGKPVPRKTEILIVIGLLALASFTRLYALHSVPYGIEGDEAKWTSEAVNLGIRGAPDHSGEYHRDALPVSYYIQMPLQRLLGPSLFAARMTVVILSIISTLVFYWLLRQVTAVPLAALAAYLLSISVFDISASRLANVESFVKLWPILTLALLALAVQTRRWQIYGLSGLALALGMLTYDTVWPLAGIAVILAMIELVRQRESVRARIRDIAALIDPTLLALPVLVPYIVSRLAYYEFGNKNWDGGTWSTLGAYLGNVVTSWFVALRSDFLYNRQGPLLNALLLPLLALGIVASFFLLKKKITYWMLIWAGLVIFTIPVIANSSMGRVYYPALPAIYALVALGAFLLWKEINRLLEKNLKPLIVAVSLVPLVWLPFFNLYIYYNEVADPSDRQMRREIAEFAAQAAREGTLILLPATPGADTPINNEYQMLELFMLQKLPPKKIAEAYRHVAPEELLLDLDARDTEFQTFEIILDKSQTSPLLTLLQECYPNGALTEGRYVDRFSLSVSALDSAACIPAVLHIETADTNVLEWELTNGSATALQPACERQRTDFEWIEAEDTFMSPGWQTEINFASGWSGTGFAMDNYGSEPLIYEVETAPSRQGYVWVRYYKRAVDNSPGYITVGSTARAFADAEEEATYQWIWENTGPFQFGKHNRILLSRPYAEDSQHFMALFVDALIVTTDPTFAPETDLWEAVPAKAFRFSSPRTGGSVSLDLPAGRYRCSVLVESDLPMVDALGNSPVVSNLVDIEIK